MKCIKCKKEISEEYLIQNQLANMCRECWDKYGDGEWNLIKEILVGMKN